MKSHILYILLFIFCQLILSSCEKESIVDGSYFVHCIMTEGEAPQIKVHSMLNVYSEYPFDLIYHNTIMQGYDLEIKNNSIDKIYSEFKNVQLKNISRENNYTPDANYSLFYSSNDSIKPKGGENYDIKIDLFEYSSKGKNIKKTISATTFIPAKVPFTITRLTDLEGRYDSIRHQILINDPHIDNNYYYLLPYYISVPSGVDINKVNTDSIWLSGREDIEDQPHIQPLFPNRCDIIGLGEIIPKSDDLLSFNTDYYGILFDDNQFKNKEKSIYIHTSNRSEVKSIYIQSPDRSEETTYLCIELFHITEDYYKYYKSILKQRKNRGDIYSEPVKVYSNIDNGYGLFAGASISKQIIKVSK